jgi:hypothetical protein
MARSREIREAANAVYSSERPAGKSALRIPNRYDRRCFDNSSTEILKLQISENPRFSRRISLLKTSRTGFNLTSVVNLAFLKAPQIVKDVDTCS